MNRDVAERGDLSAGQVALVLLIVAGFAGVVLYNATPERLRDAPATITKWPEVPSGDLAMLAHGNDLQRCWALNRLQHDPRGGRPDYIRQNVRAMIEALDDPSKQVRETAIRILGSQMISVGIVPNGSPPRPLAVELAPKVEKELLRMLGDPSASIRYVVLSSLGSTARAARLETPPEELFDRLEHDEDYHVRWFSGVAIFAYIRGAEMLVPRTLSAVGRPYPDKIPIQALEVAPLSPSMVPYLIRGLSNEHGTILNKCMKLLGDLGPDAAPALPHLLRLIRNKVRTRWPISACEHAAGQPLCGATRAFTRICTPDSPHVDEALLLSCESIRRGIEGLRGPADGMYPFDDRAEVIVKCFWSEQIRLSFDLLKALGRPHFEGSTILLEAFESPMHPGDAFRPSLAGALYTLSRNTPNQARADALLSKTWRSEKARRRELASVLEGLGPEVGGPIRELKFLRDDPIRPEAPDL